MAADEARRIITDITWLQGFYIEYLSERYKITPVQVLSGILREYIAKHHEVNLDDLKTHILGSKDLNFSAATKLQILSDVDALKARRAGANPETPPTPAVVGYKRSLRLKETNGNFSFAPIDYSIIHFYHVKASKNMPQIVRHMLRTYMVADKRLKIDEFRAYVDEACANIAKKDAEEVKDSWENFVNQRAILHEAKRSKKIG